jgi:branched-chain amino acid transport system substrate-binding protein
MKLYPFILVLTAIGASSPILAASGDAPSNAPTAQAANAPGITDTEIKIGQTMPYSGPISGYATIGKAELAYFNMVNDNGGINGRKINLISRDDGYSPPRRSSRSANSWRRTTSPSSSKVWATSPTPRSSAI